MGFFSLLGKVASKSNNLKELNKEHQAYRDYCASRSSDDLCREVKANWNNEDIDIKKKASAAYTELKSRGYSADDIKAQR